MFRKPFLTLALVVTILIGLGVCVLYEPPKSKSIPHANVLPSLAKVRLPDLSGLLGPVQRSIPRLPSAPAQVYSPATEVAIAYADARKLANAQAVRYLAMGHLDRARWATCQQAVNYAINAVSRVRRIAPATLISPTVLRIDFSNYCETPGELEEVELAFAALCQKDLFFHIITDIDDGHGKTQTVNVSQGFTNIETEAALRQVTQTPGFGAVLRADSFVVGSLSPPGYYQFAGIPNTLAAWQKKLGLDERTLQNLGAAYGANLRDSGITHKQRRLQWEPGPLGGFYTTYDSKKNDAIHDPFRRPVTINGVKNFEYNASEIFGMGRNGFFQVGVFDSAGKRLDFVDPEIAYDEVAARHGAANVLITPGYSCFRCHAENGLNSFVDNERDVFQPLRGTALFGAYDASLVDTILTFYDDPRLQRRVSFDRESHNMAVWQACGVGPAAATAAVADVVKWSLYDRISPDIACDQLRIPRGKLADIIGLTDDPNIEQLEEGHSIDQDAWAVSWTQAATKVYNGGNRAAQ